MSIIFEALLEAQQRRSNATTGERAEPLKKAWVTIADRTTQRKNMQGVLPAAKEQARPGLFQPRPFAATLLALLFLLVAAVEAYVWLSPAGVTAGLSKLTQRNTAEPERVVVRGRIEDGSLRPAHKPEAAPAWNVLQALRWSAAAMFRERIARGLNMVMQLVRQGSKLWGSYTYEGIGKDVQRRGIIEETRDLAGEKFVKRPKADSFTGTIVYGIRIEGEWSNVESARSLDFVPVSKGLLTGNAGDHRQLCGDFGSMLLDPPRNQPAP